MIVFDHATQETREFALNQQAFAREYCAMRWRMLDPCEHAPDYVFTYLHDLVVDGVPAAVMSPSLGKQVVLAVISPHGQDDETSPRAVGFIFSDEFDVDDVWNDAMYFGQLANDVGEPKALVYKS